MKFSESDDEKFIRLILKAANDGHCNLLKIMGVTFLSHNRASELLSELVEGKLLDYNQHSKMYRTTALGRKLILGKSHTQKIQWPCFSENSNHG